MQALKNLADELWKVATGKM